MHCRGNTQRPVLAAQDKEREEPSPGGKCTRVIMNTGNILGDRLRRAGVAHERRAWVCLGDIPGLGTDTDSEARATAAGRVIAGRCDSEARRRVYQHAL